MIPSAILPLLERALGHLGRLPARRLAAAAGTIVALPQIALLAWAAETYTVVQKGRAFDVKELMVAAGDVVQFSDEDEFLHQVYVESPQFSFDSPEQAPGQIISITFTVPGTYEVHCHIHPKMRLVVTVK
ncbi:MAG: cupredoxin domain-containing protein [Roseiarcus sp.]